MIGCVGFPTTKKENGETKFHRVIKMFASRNKPLGVEFGRIIPGTEGVRLFADARLMEQTSPALSVVSAFQAFVSGTQQQQGSIYLWYTPEERDISGASEGLAALMCMLGYNSGDEKCVTGVVRKFGNISTGPDALLDISVDHVDCIEEKLLGCEQAGVHLGYPVTTSDGDEVRYRSPYGAPLKTVGDAVKFLSS